MGTFVSDCMAMIGEALCHRNAWTKVVLSENGQLWRTIGDVRNNAEVYWDKVTIADVRRVVLMRRTKLKK